MDADDFNSDSATDALQSIDITLGALADQIKAAASKRDAADFEYFLKLRDLIEGVVTNTGEIASHTNDISEPRLDEINKALQALLFWEKSAFELQAAAFREIKREIFWFGISTVTILFLIAYYIHAHP